MTHSLRSSLFALVLPATLTLAGCAELGTVDDAATPADAAPLDGASAIALVIARPDRVRVVQGLTECVELRARYADGSEAVIDPAALAVSVSTEPAGLLERVVTDRPCVSLLGASVGSGVVRFELEDGSSSAHPVDVLAGTLHLRPWVTGPVAVGGELELRMVVVEVRDGATTISAPGELVPDRLVVRSSSPTRLEVEPRAGGGWRLLGRAAGEAEVWAEYDVPGASVESERVRLQVVDPLPLRVVGYVALRSDDDVDYWFSEGATRGEPSLPASSCVAARLMGRHGDGADSYLAAVAGATWTSAGVSVDGPDRFCLTEEGVVTLVGCAAGQCRRIDLWGRGERSPAHLEVAVEQPASLQPGMRVCPRVTATVRFDDGSTLDVSESPALHLVVTSDGVQEDAGAPITVSARWRRALDAATASFQDAAPGAPCFVFQSGTGLPEASPFPAQLDARFDVLRSAASFDVVRE